jgi:hypothetical protein
MPCSIEHDGSAPIGTFFMPKPAQEAPGAGSF